MEEMNGIIVATRVLGDTIAQLENDLRVERYLKDDFKAKFENLQREYEITQKKCTALIDKLNEYCARGNT